MIHLVGKHGKSTCVKTKIVATIGPACEDKKILLQMLKGGMAIARLNFSHGSHEHHLEIIRRLREISKEEDLPVTILQDLCGPKIRLGKLPQPVALKKNQLIKLSIGPNPETQLFTDFKELPAIVKPGEAILINDGYIEMKVKAIEKDYLICKVITPGIATSRKGINLPDSDESIPVFTQQDGLDLEFGLQHGIDLVAMSFVDAGENILPAKALMAKYNREIPVIAKIERPIALKNIDGILEAFDGIMVARGDLGVEVPLEEVPIIQKKLIHLANGKNKVVITATQMLESMIDNPRPTRAEASDVSNAILDGSDAVMLSGETAVGKYPVKTVQMMRRIARTTEGSPLYPYALEHKKDVFDHTEAIARSAAKIARDLGAKFILVFSFTGNTALRLSKYKPSCPVFAFSSQPEVVDRMNAYWGILPFLIPHTTQTDEMIHFGEEVIKGKGLIKTGDLVITVSGRAPMRGATNMLKISRFNMVTEI